MLTGPGRGAELVDGITGLGPATRTDDDVDAILGAEVLETITFEADIVVLVVELAVLDPNVELVAVTLTADEVPVATFTDFSPELTFLSPEEVDMQMVIDVDVVATLGGIELAALVVLPGPGIFAADDTIVTLRVKLDDCGTVDAVADDALLTAGEAVVEIGAAGRDPVTGTVAVGLGPLIPTGAPGRSPAL